MITGLLAITCSVAVAKVDKKLPLVADSGHLPDNTENEREKVEIRNEAINLN